MLILTAAVYNLTKLFPMTLKTTKHYESRLTKKIQMNFLASPIYTVQGSEVYSCEYVKHFLYYYLLTTVLLAIQTTCKPTFSSPCIYVAGKYIEFFQQTKDYPEAKWAVHLNKHFAKEKIQLPH